MGEAAAGEEHGQVGILPHVLISAYGETTSDFAEIMMTLDAAARTACHVVR